MSMLLTYFINVVTYRLEMCSTTVVCRCHEFTMLTCSGYKVYNSTVWMSWVQVHVCKCGDCWQVTQQRPLNVYRDITVHWLLNLPHLMMDTPVIYVDLDITALLVGWPHVPIHCDFGLLSHCLILWFSLMLLVWHVHKCIKFAINVLHT